MKDKPNKPSKFRSKNWVVISDDSHGVYSTVKTMMSKTSYVIMIIHIRL